MRAVGQALARRMCISCHAFSTPDVLPRSSWRPEIEKMSVILAGGTMPSWGEPRPPVTLSPEYQAILAWYEREAPAALPSPEPWPAPDGRPVRFVKRIVPFKDALTPEPAVSNVHLADLEADGRLDVLATDMRQGLVFLARPYDPDAGAVPIAQVPHPAHVSVVDLDGDGRRDLLVADLGEFYPGDHEKGAAVWLRSLPSGGYATFSFGGFPRVADVEAADFDGDGKLRALVAGFGWHSKGDITVMLNRTEDWSQPRFERSKVDGRAPST